MCFLLVVLATAVFAADVTGKWTAQLPGRGGNAAPPPGKSGEPGRGGRGGAPAEAIFDLKAEGNKLTGTAQTPMFGRGPAEAAKITDGKVDGNNISFTVPSNMGIEMYYKGVVSGDTIEFSRTSDFDDYGTPPVKFTAKRAK